MSQYLTSGESESVGLRSNLSSKESIRSAWSLSKISLKYDETGDSQNGKHLVSGTEILYDLVCPYVTMYVCHIANVFCIYPCFHIFQEIKMQ